MSAGAPKRLPDQFGRYRILRLLGQGGMGAVYLARDSQLDREVALKVPQFTGQADSPVLERFYQEARAAATIRHANICPVYEVGQIDGIHYLTMAYIEGKPLADWVSSGKQLTLRQIATLVRKLALALLQAHLKGVIHRDLKPANVMMDRQGEPIVMDFGLARRETPGNQRITQSGLILGSPAYMAPEQIKGNSEEIGPACDIYSLGVILYELITHRLPFDGDDMMAVLSQALLDEPPAPSTFRPDLDATLEAICLKALAKKKEARYPSMVEFASALQDFLRGSAPVVAAPPKPAKPAPGIHVSDLGGRRSMIQAYRENLGTEAQARKQAIAVKQGRRAGKVKPAASRTHRLAIVGSTLILALLTGILVFRSKNSVTEDDVDESASPGLTQLAANKDPVNPFNPGPAGSKNSMPRSDPDSLPAPATNGRPAEQSKAGPVEKNTATPPRLSTVEPRGSRPTPLLAPVVGPGRDVGGGWPGAHVLSVAYTPDSRWLLVGSDIEPYLRLHEINSNRVIPLVGHKGWVHCVAISPDGKQALSGSQDGFVFLWDPPARKIFWNHGKPVVSVAFSPAGDQGVSCCADKIVRVWNLNSPTVLRSFSGHAAQPLCAVFSVDGRKIISADKSGTVLLWDKETEKIDERLDKGGHAVACSPDGKWIASGGRRILWFWNRANGRKIRAVLDDDQQGFQWLRFSPDSRWLLATDHQGQALSIWDVAMRKRLARLPLPADQKPNRGVIAPDGRSVACGIWRDHIYTWPLQWR